MSVPEAAAEEILTMLGDCEDDGATAEQVRYLRGLLAVRFAEDRARIDGLTKALGQIARIAVLAG